MSKPDRITSNFKGSSSAYNPNDINNISPVEIAQTKVAVRNFNQYMKDKPLIESYLADVGRDPSLTSAIIKGQAGADLAQKNAALPGNPNQGMANPAVSARLGNKVYGDLSRDAVSQQAAAKNGAVSSMMGLNSDVNTAQEGMARDAVSRNLESVESSYAKKAATTSAVASGLGSAGAMYYNQTKAK